MTKRPTVVTPTRIPGGQAGLDATADSSVVEGQVLTVFSPKGGSGCTTVSINLAVALANQGARTILVDLSLQFGDVSVMLNMKPVTTIIDVAERANDLDAELINTVVQVHKSGLNVLLAPRRPEMADMVSEEIVKQMISVLREMYEYIIIDTSSNLNDITLSLLDTADRILLVTQQSLPSLKNIRNFFELSDSLDYRADKVWLVANRISSKSGISVKDISNILKRPVIMTIPVNDLVANIAADQGVPIVVGDDRRQPIGIQLTKLADHVLQELGQEESPDGQGPTKTKKKQGGFLSRLFGRNS